MDPAAEVTTAGLYAATEHILGQEHARQMLANLLRRQWLVAQGRYERSHGALAAGATGVGKTFLIRTMCQQAGLPFAEVNATQFTDVGYVGMNLSQMFLPLILSAIGMRRAALEEQYGASVLDSIDDSNPESVLKVDHRILGPAVEAAESGVVLLDEFDKWMIGETHDPGSKVKSKKEGVPEGRNVGRKLQAELLKIVEGSDVYVTDKEEELGQVFNTERVLVIAAGAFIGIDKIINDRTGREMTDDPRQWERTEPKDFEHFGLLPELAGRLAVHIAFKPLREHHIIQMIDDSGLLTEFEERFHNEGCGMVVENGAMQIVAKNALNLGIGARGLRHVMERTFGPALFEASMNGGGTVVLDATAAQGKRARWVAD